MHWILDAELFLIVMRRGLQQLQTVLDPLVDVVAVGIVRKIGLEAVPVQPLIDLLTGPLGKRQRVQIVVAHVILFVIEQTIVAHTERIVL